MITLFPIDHVNYIGSHPEKGIIVASVEVQSADKKKLGAVIRTYNDTKVVTLQFSGKDKDIKKNVLQIADFPTNLPLKEIRDAKFKDELKDFEEKELTIRQRYKFGILYAKSTDVTEIDMFSNGFLISTFDFICRNINLHVRARKP